MDKFWKPFIKQVEEKRVSNAPNLPRRNSTKPARNAENINCKSNSAKWAVSLRVPAIPNAATRATLTKPPKKPPSASPKRKQSKPNSTDASVPNAADGWCTNTAVPAANSSAAPTIRNANTSSRWKNPKIPASNARNAKKATSSNANPATANCFTVAAPIPTATTPLGTRPSPKNARTAIGRFLTIKTTKRWGVEKSLSAKRIAAGKNRLNRLHRKSNWLKLG